MFWMRRSASIRLRSAALSLSSWVRDSLPPESGAALAGASSLLNVSSRSYIILSRGRLLTCLVRALASAMRSLIRTCSAESTICSLMSVRSLPCYLRGLLSVWCPGRMRDGGLSTQQCNWRRHLGRRHCLGRCGRGWPWPRLVSGHLQRSRFACARAGGRQPL